MRHYGVSVVFGLCLVVASAGCSGTASDDTAPAPSAAPPYTGPPAAGSIDAANELTGLAAVAKDNHYIADYAWTRERGDSPVTVSVTLANDGSWRVDVPGGAHGGKADITLVRNKQGHFQCVLEKEKTCVRVSGPEAKLPREYDPLVQHVFTDWMDILLTRSAPLSIAYADTPKNVAAADRCFSLERNSVTVNPPIPASVLCLSADGVVTAADSNFGSLRLDGEVMPPASRAKMPAAVTDDEPLSTSPPPKPSPTKSGKDNDDEKKDDD